MQYLDDDLDLTAQKLKYLEKELMVNRELISSCIESIKDTQRYLMKLAYNQAELTKKISTWPYIVVPSEKPENDES